VERRVCKAMEDRVDKDGVIRITPPVKKVVPHGRMFREQVDEFLLGTNGCDPVFQVDELKLNLCPARVGCNNALILSAVATSREDQRHKEKQQGSSYVHEKALWFYSQFPGANEKIPAALSAISRRLRVTPPEVTWTILDWSSNNSKSIRLVTWHVVQFWIPGARM